MPCRGARCLTDELKRGGIADRGPELLEVLGAWRVDGNDCAWLCIRYRFDSCLRSIGKGYGLIHARKQGAWPLLAQCNQSQQHNKHVV